MSRLASAFGLRLGRECVKSGVVSNVKGQAKVKRDKGGRFGILGNRRDASAEKRGPSTALGMTGKGDGQPDNAKSRQDAGATRARATA